MFKKKLFGKNIEPACEYCEHGNLTIDGAMVLCEKKGLMEKSFHCRAYLYSPLKREPKRSPILKPHDKSEFEI